MPPRSKRPNLYDELEPPIRPLVRLLRDNGFNTVCSCGHGMWVELEVYGYMDDLERIRNLLLEHGYKDFTVTGEVMVRDMWPNRRAKVYLGDYLRCDDTSAREFISKIGHFKMESERFHQQNYHLRQSNKRLREEAKRLRRELRPATKR
jgi:hypothetical protein